ncbi:MAG TPA: VCBS repeat-containing protein [Puia sp.]|nr:VCBS repeat-containing protein [Puia sp.]
MFSFKRSAIFCMLPAAVFLLNSCNSKNTLFQQVSSGHSGIHFNNQITENDSVNPFDLTNIYNGGGVGIGDFNGDGLQDIYFTGNQVSNKLYLNKGDFKFDDVTAAAGVGGNGEWCRGVSVVDINNDGWPDIYVCATIRSDPNLRKNLLYINQGPDKDGVPHFKEMAKEYGLGDTLYSTMAAFFDYDNDGDLDMYLTVNEIPKGFNAGLFRPIVSDGSFPSTGRLYRNDWNDSLKHPVFTDVSKQAGITFEGFGHDATIADINQDGWKDIYVSNDFVGDDILYINNHDGTFTNKVKSYFKHTSANGMGQDIEDINNDGLADLIELDMNPADNYRKKVFLNANNYLMYQNSDYFGYQYQYVRNSLQLNQGPRVNNLDSIGDPIFSEISFYSGIAETDWSWTPLVVDFNNDGYRDVIITSGYPKDVTDHDFINFHKQANNYASKQSILDQIPQVKIHSSAFSNNGDLTFTDVSKAWGLTIPAFSNGAAYADLDNDGAMDLIINNINDEAMIFRNTSRDNNKDHNHYLQIKLAGDSLNKNGLGAWIELHYDHGKQQVYEYTPYRGYLSTIQDIAHFGLGNVSVVDSVMVKWPNKKMQLLQHIKADQVLKINIADADRTFSYEHHSLADNSLFKEVTDSVNIHYQQQENDFIDFNIQRLLPHKFSEYGPSLAVGDVDGNGLDDIIIGGSASYSAQIFLQQPNGKFIQRPLIRDADAKNKIADDEGMLLFDADGDGDLDLYVCSGGYENAAGSVAYQDRLYINDGKGNFTLDSTALPKNFTSKFCVRAADYDHDGDLDLFVSGRVKPGEYPQAVSSFIYRNDSKNGHVQFTDVTDQVAKDLNNIGMVCDAIWTDFDNDGWPDLVLAGEWMPVTFLKNDHGVFKNITPASGISNQTGWWNTIVAGDFDNDGDIDYVVGNLGQNSFYRASDAYPVRVYGKDFDNNGVYDMITSLYLPDKNGDRKEFPSETRDDLLKQMTSMRKKFPDYKSYATATMDQVLSPEQKKGATILAANNFQTSYIRNEGNGKFTMIPLPAQAQFSVINGMVAEDFDGDGNLDIVMNGNDYGTEVSTGRYDALNGLFLKGDGKGNFRPESILESGIFIPGNGKALVKLKSAGNSCLLAAGQNRGPVKIFELKRKINCLSVQPSDVAVILTYKNGTSRKQELYYGSSFLSQSSRFLNIDDSVLSAIIIDNKGKKRDLRLH